MSRLRKVAHAPPWPADMFGWRASHGSGGYAPRRRSLPLVAPSRGVPLGYVLSRTPHVCHWKVLTESNVMVGRRPLSGGSPRKRARSEAERRTGAGGRRLPRTGLAVRACAGSIQTTLPVERSVFHEVARSLPVPAGRRARHPLGNLHPCGGWRLRCGGWAGHRRRRSLTAGRR